MKSNLLDTLKMKATQMTPTHRRVADYILKNPVDASFMTLEQIAGIVGTSTTTVMRLCFSLDYTGYSEFQKELQELLRDRVSPTARLEFNKKDLVPGSLLSDCADNQVKNITQTLEYLLKETAEQCLPLILGASTIYFVGMRSSYAVAYYLHQALNQILQNCVLLKANSGDNVETILGMKPADLVIAVTLPRYSRSTVETVKALKGYGPKVIAMTDGYNSPLAPYADIVLPCAFHSLAFHNSIAGAILLADYLITAIALQEPLVTKARLEAAEPVLKKLNILVDV